MINFNTNSFNALANLKVCVRGVDTSKTSSQSTTSKGSESGINATNSSKTNATNSANSASVNKILGYGVDSEGYFTSDFNEAAGIPKDYKIHSSTAQSIVNMSLNEKTGFLNVDIAQTFGNAYKILSQVVGEGVLNSKDSFTMDDIAGFAQGYHYDRPSLEVQKSYDTIYSFVDAIMGFDFSKGDDDLEYLFYNASANEAVLKPATDIFSNSNGGREGQVPPNFSTTSDKYTNKDGSITKGGLLVAVINQNKALIEGETNLRAKLNNYDRNVNSSELMRWIGALPLTMPVSDRTEIQALEDDLMKTSDINEIKSKILKIKQRSNEIFETERSQAKKLEENYKDPIMQLLEEILARIKEQTQKALQKQRENMAEKQSVDIRA